MDFAPQIGRIKSFDGSSLVLEWLDGTYTSIWVFWKHNNKIITETLPLRAMLHSPIAFTKSMRLKFPNVANNFEVKIWISWVCVISHIFHHTQHLFLSLPLHVLMWDCLIDQSMDYMIMCIGEINMVLGKIGTVLYCSYIYEYLHTFYIRTDDSLLNT